MYQHYTPAAWSGGRVLALWDGTTSGDPNLTLSRFAADGSPQGEPLRVASAAASGRLHVAAHDATLGLLWSEDGDFGYRVYFQQAQSCP